MGRKCKKVVFNGIDLESKNYSGIQRYNYEILNAIDKIVSKDDNFEVVVPSNVDFTFKNIKIVVLNYNIKNKISKYVWNYLIFNRYSKKRNCIKIDLALGFTLFTDIIAIYDCRELIFPINSNSLYKKMTRILFLLRQYISIKSSKLIITDSNTAGNDIEKYYNVDKDNVHTLYCGYQHFYDVHIDSSVINEYNLSNEDFIFSLGSRYAHKNFKWILYAAKQNPKYKFIVTGSKNYSDSDSFLENSKTDNLIFTGYLNDGQVKALMSKCKAFVLPSFYEGFGIPPLEALSVGAEIIISNLTSLPEIYEDSAHYIDPYNYDNIDIDNILSTKVGDPKRILDKYSWEKSAKKLLSIIKEVMNEEN